MGVHVIDEVDPRQRFHEIGHPRAKDQQKQQAAKNRHAAAAAMQNSGDNLACAVDSRGGHRGHPNLRHVGDFTALLAGVHFAARG